MHTCCSRHELANYIYCTRAGSFPTVFHWLPFQRDNDSNTAPLHQFPMQPVPHRLANPLLLASNGFRSIPAQLWLVTSGPWPKGSYFITSDDHTAVMSSACCTPPFHGQALDRQLHMHRAHRLLVPCASCCINVHSAFPSRYNLQPATSLPYALYNG